MNYNQIHRYVTTIMFLLIFLLPFSLAQSGTGPDMPRDPYASMRFSPSMAIIIVILIAALFFMGFFSIYIRQCTDTNGGASVAPVAARGTNNNAQRGLDREIIEKFPTFVYSDVKTLKIGKGALECAVCLDEFEDDETLRLIPKCDHVFHPECVDEWLTSHTTCPVCRASLIPEEFTDSTNSIANDVEAQNESEHQEEQETEPLATTTPPEVMNRNQSLHRNRTRRASGSTRPRKFPRSHSTGHSLVQPGENTERFTLRLPVDVRKQIMNKELNRANSMVVLPMESGSRRGYRTGGGEGSSRGKNGSVRRLDRVDRSFKSDRWVFSMAPPFFSRASSIKSPKVVAANVDNSSPVGPDVSSGESSRLPV